MLSAYLRTQNPSITSLSNLEEYTQRYSGVDPRAHSMDWDHFSISFGITAFPKGSTKHFYQEKVWFANSAQN